ncbi:MAG: ATPase [Methanosarcinaceae archaeon]|nr:ATPase [Methanosarcinaceae archaeon]
MRCVLPDSTPNIRFDHEGVCNYCRNHQKIEYKGEDALIKSLETQKAKGGEYDCIVPISGGRDSTYVLLKMAKDYFLNVLAVNYENPFTDSLAKENLRNAVDILGVDIIKIKDKNRIHERVFNNNINVFFQNPNPSMFPLVCTACRAVVPYEIYKIAKKKNVSCIINGNNPFEEAPFKLALLNLISEEDLGRKTFSKSVFRVLKQSSKNAGYFKPLCIQSMLKDYFFANHFTGKKAMRLFNTANINLFSYVEWDEEEILSRLQSELKWKSPLRINSTWRFDCKVGFLKDFVYKTSLNMTEKDDFYSIMIRENKITRDEAIKRLEWENQIYYDEVLSLLKPLGFEDNDLEDLKGKLHKLY